MKMKTPAALLTFALARAAIAQDGSGGVFEVSEATQHPEKQIQQTKQASHPSHLVMPQFTDPFSRDNRPIRSSTSGWKPSLQARRRLRKISSGIVNPRRVIRKEERKELRTERIDSKIDALDGQADEDAAEEYAYSFAALKDKFVTHLRSVRSLDRDIEEHFAPGACANTGNILRDGRKPSSLRSLIVLIILLLIVFGALYNLVEYLLLATRASACNVSTVYIPVPYTVTVGTSNASSTPLVSSASGSSSAAPPVTSTSTQIVTSYVTVDAAPTASTLPYVYTVDPSGSTYWVNGVSPSSGISLVTATTSVFISAVPSTPPVVEPVTVPTYTSTEYTYVGPDVTLTSTSTSTNYVTFTLSSASPNSTGSRSSFAGIGSGGWNASTSAVPALSPASMSSMEPALTTLTSVYYRSSGDLTTSTITTSITTTISMRYTVTLTRSESSSAFVTTITALPVTITDQFRSQSTGSSASNSISTTLNGSGVGAVTGSMSSNAGIEPAATQGSIAPSLLLTYPAPNILSTYSYAPAPSSSLLPVQSTGFPVPVNSSAADAQNGMPPARSSTPQSNFTTTSPTSALGLSSPAVQMTSTVSGGRPLTSPNSSTTNSANGVIPATASTNSTSNLTVVPFITSTMSAGASSFGPVSMTANSSMAGATSNVNPPATSPTINSTLSIVSTGHTVTTSSPIPGSSLTSLASTLSSSLPLPPYNPVPSARVPSSRVPLSSLNTTIRSSVLPASSNAAASPDFHTSTLSGATMVNGFSTYGTVSTKSIGTTLSSVPTTSTIKSPSSAVRSSTNATNPFPASSATATPTAGCGEHGDFTIDFDNLPNFMPTNQNQTDITQAPPVPNPYYHLTFSDGYIYAPQPSEPFTPVSSPHLAVFLATGSGNRVRTPFGNYSKPGEISDGPRESISAFWFDAYNAFLGCDNPGPEACTLVLSAYTWSPTAKTEILASKQNATIAACPELKDCQLKQVNFPEIFRGLTGLQIQAFVGNQEKMFFMDDLALHWSNNTCAAGMLRQSSL